MKTSKKSNAYLGLGGLMPDELVPLTIHVPPGFKKFAQWEAKREGFSLGRWIELSVLASVLQDADRRMAKASAAIDRANAALDRTLANMESRAERRAAADAKQGKKALPFEPLVPNETIIAVIREAEGLHGATEVARTKKAKTVNKRLSAKAPARPHKNSRSKPISKKATERVGLGTALAESGRRAGSTDEDSPVFEQVHDKTTADFVAELVKVVEDAIPAGEGRGFNAPHWIAAWLETPQPSLGGKRPEEFLDTADGRAIIWRLLSCVIAGSSYL